jgi:hypothetical protein
MAIVAKTGNRITLTYENREFDVIIIDPNGLGEGQPSVGLGFRMMEKYSGIPNDTLSRWVDHDLTFEGAGQISNKVLKLPSGKTLRVLDIIGNDDNTYSVVEIADWFDLTIDLLINPGKWGKSAKSKLGNFIRWFAVKGFYAETYTAIKGVYTAKDSRATTKWLQLRQDGKLDRKAYTDLLQSQGCTQFDYAHWTDVVYLGLFGMKSKEMKAIWECVDGNVNIARNYISQEAGLLAVRHCESLVVDLFVDSVEEAHKIAINTAKRKFLVKA